MSRNRLDLTGRKFGRLTVIEYSHTAKKTPYWRCICECGNEKIAKRQLLTDGKTTSCGCKFTEIMIARNQTHGMSHTNEYRIWQAMKERCYCPRNVHYSRYGGRGIQVCSGWRNDFESFLRDMGARPSKRHSIDRVDNDKGYSCGHCEECLRNDWSANCQWRNDVEQANNRHNNIKVTYDNRQMTLLELSSETGIPYSTLHGRHRLGKPLVNLSDRYRQSVNK